MENHTPFPMFKKYKQKPQVCEQRLFPAISTKFYLHELGFDTWTIEYVCFPFLSLLIWYFLPRLFLAQMALASLVAISGPPKVAIFRAHPLQWPSKWIFPHQNHHVPRHINNRYTNINTDPTVFTPSQMFTFDIACWPAATDAGNPAADWSLVLIKIYVLDTLWKHFCHQYDTLNKFLLLQLFINPKWRAYIHFRIFLKYKTNTTIYSATYWWNLECNWVKKYFLLPLGGLAITCKNEPDKTRENSRTEA